MPPHNNPAAITQQFETTQEDMSHDTEIPTGPTTSPVPDVNEILAQIANEESIPITDTLISNNSSIEATRTSTRTKTKRDFLLTTEVLWKSLQGTKQIDSHLWKTKGVYKR